MDQRTGGHVLAIDRLLSGFDRHPALGSFLAVLAIYLLTAQWTLPYHIDPLTNVLSAWSLGARGSLVLEGYEEFTGPDFYNRANQLVATEHGPISKYPPGSALLAAPLYSIVDDRSLAEVVFYSPTSTDDRQLLATRTLLPPVWPATLAAALATATAVAVLVALLSSELGPRWSSLIALIVGLGTSLWSVAADALWQHGPAALGIALGLLGLARQRYLLGSAGLALAVIARPQTAVIVATLGLWAAFRERSTATLLKVGVLPAAAAGAYVALNMWAFGQPLVRETARYWVPGTTDTNWWNTLEPFLGAILSPTHGLFIWSPFVALGLLGVTHVWESATWWARAGAVAAILYLIVQVRGNGYVGGEGFRWYRYQLEAVAVAAPILGYSLRHLWGRTEHWRRAVFLTAGYAIAVHGFAAISSSLH